MLVRIDTSDPPSIRVEGQEIRKPTEADINAFNLHDLPGVVEWTLGVKPKAVYMDDPLPWGDQSFGKYGWQPIRTVVRYAEGWIDSIETSPYIADVKTFENTFTKPATFNAEVSRSVSNTMERNWTVGASVGFEQSVYYEVGGDAAGGKVGGSTTISAEASYGEGGRTEKTEEVSSGAGVEVTLDPGETATAKLSASHGTLVAKGRVVAALQGGLFIDMGKRWNGHFFHYLPVARWRAMQHESIETIRVDFYSNAHIGLA